MTNSLIRRSTDYEERGRRIVIFRTDAWFKLLMAILPRMPNGSNLNADVICLEKTSERRYTRAGQWHNKSIELKLTNVIVHMTNVAETP